MTADDRPTRAEAMADEYDDPADCEGWHSWSTRSWETGEPTGRCDRCGLTVAQAEAFDEGRRDPRP
jgi:hypothetical protein